MSIYLLEAEGDKKQTGYRALLSRGSSSGRQERGVSAKIILIPGKLVKIIRENDCKMCCKNMFAINSRCYTLQTVKLEGCLEVIGFNSSCTR